MINRESYPVNAIKDKLSDSEIERINVKNLLAEIEKLPQKEKMTLQMRYKEKKTLRECGKALGLSHARIRSLQEQACKRLTNTSMKLSYIEESKEKIDELMAQCSIIAQTLNIDTDDNKIGELVLALSKPVHDLNIGKITLDTLNNLGIDRTLNLAKISENEFLKMRLVGPKILAEVNIALKEMGLPPLRKE